MKMSESKKGFRFFNVAPFAPGREAQLACDMIEFRDRTGIDEILYSLTLHPEGLHAWRKVEYAAASYRKLRQALEGSGIRLGVLLQSILGHWPRVDREEECWTRTVNIDGDKVRYCPLDSRFRQYIFDLVALLAREKPVFVLGDDDIRAFSPRAECFCELHTAEFNRRSGCDFSSEQYRKAVRISQPGEMIFEQYERLRQDTVNGVMTLIREALDSVDPSIAAGSCMPGNELHFNGAAAAAVAAKGSRPVMRIANAGYMESSPKELPYNIIHTQSLREFWPDHFLLDESDTCLHTLYSRAARSMHAKLCSSILSGLDGAKLWYVNAHRGRVPISRNYTDILAEHAGFYQALAVAANDSELCGAVIPCHTIFRQWHPDSPNERPIPDRNWGNVIFGFFGIPFRCSLDCSADAVYTLAGEESVARLTDADLTAMFRRKLLIDGPAAVALTGRGFAGLMGVTAEKGDFTFNLEVRTDDGSLIPLANSPEMPFLRRPDEASEIFTELCYSAFAGSPDCTVVSPGTVLSVNPLGGRVCVTSFHLAESLWLLTEERKRWLLDILDWLEGEEVLTPWALTAEQPATILWRRRRDGSALLGIFNLSFDAMPEIGVRCGTEPVSVEKLSPAGTWEALPFEWAAPQLRIPQTLECYECLILRVDSR